ASLRRRPRSATSSPCRRSTGPRRPCGSPAARSTARWSGCAARAFRTWARTAAAISSCTSTSRCRARSRRISARSTSVCAISKERRSRSTTRAACSIGSETPSAASDPERGRGVRPRERRWYELAVPAHAEAVEAVSEILTRVGHRGIAVDLPVEPRGGTDHTVKAYLLVDGEVVAKVNDVRDALGHLQAFGLGPIGELAVREITEDDWLESWKAQFTPLRIGRFLVRPTWSDAPVPADTIELVLDPGMAFGTGLHPTTQQCLEALSALAIEAKSVLDVGTRCGILAIAAAKRGAAPVVAADTDPLAVDATRENAERNRVAIPVGLGSAAD